MSFTCYPIILSKVEGKEFPSINSVLSDILDTGEIPLRVITDIDDEIFKEIQSQIQEYKIECIIMVVKYLTKFSA